MKRAFFFIAALCLSLTACGTGAETAQQPSDRETELVTVTVSTGVTTAADLKPVPSQDTLTNDLAYEIKRGDFYNSQLQQRGYYMDVIDGRYRYTICSGEYSTGGYGISITGIEISDAGTVIITVQQTAPKEDEPVTEAFTYPNCAVTFSKEPPAGVMIENTAGTEFEYLGPVPPAEED